MIEEFSRQSLSDNVVVLPVIEKRKRTHTRTLSSKMPKKTLDDCDNNFQKQNSRTDNERFGLNKTHLSTIDNLKDYEQNPVSALLAFAANCGSEQYQHLYTVPTKDKRNSADDETMDVSSDNS